MVRSKKWDILLAMEGAQDILLAMEGTQVILLAMEGVQDTKEQPRMEYPASNGR